MLRDPDAPNDRISQDALKYFTDRTGFIDAFLHRLNQSEHDPLKVLVFHGVGGIGKTTLVRKLGQDLHAGTALFPHPPLPSARFDMDTLQSPVQAYREALVRLRADLGTHFHVNFSRFDRCLAVMLAHEGGASPDMVRINPVLNEVYNATLGLVPFLSPLAKVTGKMIQGAAKKPGLLEDWLRQAGGTEEILDLRRRALHNDQTLPDELIRRFAADLGRSLPARPGRACRAVVFLDSYERLWTGREADRSAQSRRLDEWVRDLADACLRAGVLPVITGRDRLRWDNDDPKWQDRLDQHLMGGLSAHDAQIFLSKCGIGPDASEPPTLLQSAIIQCSNENKAKKDEAGRPAPISCHTLWLALCAEIVLNTRLETQADPPPETFRTVPAGKEADELADRFLRSLHSRPMEMWLEELSLTPRFDKQAALVLRGAEDRYQANAAWELLTGFSFATPQPDGFWRLHETMRDALRLRVSPEAAREVHERLHDHWTGRGNEALAFFHRWSLDPQGTLNTWTQQHAAALRESRIMDARRLLTEWADVALNDADRAALGDELWAETHFSLGYSSSDTPIAPRATVLTSAIEHHQAALRVYTEADFPQDWAMTQNNLGIAYRNLPAGDRAENLRRAIEHYQDALHIYTEADFPQQWAATQNNLGIAYSDLPAGDRAENLRRAIEHYQDALHIYTEADFPQQWAATQNNLGIAYRNLPAGDRAENLRRAIEHYQDALHIYTEADFPQDWAMTQNNLGIAYRNLPAGDRAENLRRAIEHYQDALHIYTEADFPQQWAATQNNLGNASLLLLQETMEINLLTAAWECFVAAERGYTIVGLTDTAVYAASRRDAIENLIRQIEEAQHENEAGNDTASVPSQDDDE